jgi:LacI family transcriptional regulator
VPVTIYDIAREADVSIATVSRVFNDSQRVSDQTRARVQDVAQTLGYRPHAMAQGLARRSTQLVSAVIPVLTNYFYMEVLRGIQDALGETDYDLIVYSAATPDEVDGQLARALQRGRSEGLLLLSTPVTPERRKVLVRSRQPIVLVDACDAEFDSILVDNVEGAYRATRHLIEGGRQRIAHVTVSPEPLVAQQRREGYERALAEVGLEPVVCASQLRPLGFCEAAGYQAAQDMLRLDARPDAVFVATDVQALGVLSALHDAGLSVPDDVAVVGFDDIKPSAYARLSTVCQPMYQMGRLAVERLLTRLDAPERAPQTVRFAPELVVRPSSPAHAAA